MRCARPFIAPLLATLILAGCGGSATGPATGSASAEKGQLALVSQGGDVTDGRTGDAVTGTEAGPLRELSRGGRPDPSDPPRPRGLRDGVGAGDGCTDSDLVPSAANLGQVEAVTLCLLNGQRADRGLPALSTNARLARAAEGHAADMVRHSYFAHEGRNGSDITDRIGATGYIPADGRWVIGENLAWGTGALATPRSIVNAWMNSTGHRANVLHPAYREIGFGIVVGNPKASDGFGATFVTEFGVRGDGAATAPRSGTPAADARGRPGSGAGERTSERGAGRRAKSRRERAGRARAQRVRNARERAAKSRAAKVRAAKSRAARARAN
jgi:uncharacterized protein YkwD